MFTIRLPRTATLLLAGISTALSFGTVVAPAQAAPSSATVTATLAEAGKDARVVAGNTLWSCKETTCTTRVSGTRPGRLCRDLKRKAGTIVAFTINGTALDAEALARCNA